MGDGNKLKRYLPLTNPLIALIITNVLLATYRFLSLKSRHIIYLLLYYKEMKLYRLVYLLVY